MSVVKVKIYCAVRCHFSALLNFVEDTVSNKNMVLIKACTGFERLTFLGWNNVPGETFENPSEAAEKFGKQTTPEKHKKMMLTLVKLQKQKITA